ncbi:PTS sugar transporter subunit IIA [Salinibacterium sp. M195]|uniref:PTS sugar transporter subunit IIA n=1 Tax=Salinibacterium sp. M195 TaxID=2583374 RepID=UPI001C637C92|nr:PTS sugar transporter subunit IIA [Salinibacterium sp. M195]QYH35370.1 PTS mannitol transporter subunit IIA [Salinibacterium sp. M195]
MSKVLELSQIKAAGTARTKEEAIAEAADILIAAGAVTPEYLDFMKAREEMTSTFMGNFLAIPHGTNEGKDTILSSALSFVRYADPLDWDGNEVRFVVGIAGKDGGHMDTLAGVATIFSDNDEVQKLVDASDEEELLSLLAELNNA